MNLIKLLDIANPKKIKDTINAIIGITDTANTNASSALTNSQNAVNTANIANTNASTALSNSQEAVSTANAASSTANTALTNSQTAVTTANSANTTSNTALTNSQTAISTANTASTAAQSAVADADDALANSLEALGIAQTSSTESSEAKQIAEEALAIIEEADARSEEASLLAEQAAADADDAVDTAELALNTANAARSAVDQALDLGQWGTFVHNTSGIALAHAYMTDNVAQTDDTTLDRYYAATPKLVRDALASYYTKTETDTLLNAKADTNNVYTKTETDTALSGKANTNDIPTVNNATLTIQLNGGQVQTFSANEATNKTANIQALPNYNLSIGSTNGGNPRQVLFVSINYTNFTSESGAYFKLGAMSSHGNGSSYTFLEDIFINVNYNGDVSCDLYKYTQQAVTLDAVNRNYGDVFWTIDTTTKIVNFYILLGQYSYAQFTPGIKIGRTRAITTENGITQYSGSPSYYSSGTKNWATGNSTLYARQSDIPTNYVTTDTAQEISARKTFNTGGGLLATGKTAINTKSGSFYLPGIEMGSNSVDGLAGIDLEYSYGLTLWCKGSLGASSAGNYQRPYFRIGNVGYYQLAGLEDLLYKVYPVGSIYMSTVNTSPASFLGGTWVQIKDTFLLSAGDTYSAGASGGEATHTLTENEMPNHTHYLAVNNSGGALLTGKPGGIMINQANSVWDSNGAFTDRGPSSYPTDQKNISSTGGDAAHNNMPPYLVVYMWKRTA